jgi:hypothetical protein
MKNKTDRLVSEFCSKSNLSDFEKEIANLIAKIKADDADVSCCDTCEASVIEQSMDRKNMIRISFKYKKDNPIHYLWDLIHEYGHHLSGQTENRTIDINREIEAWDNGMKYLKGVPSLLKHASDYENYREKCLDSYRKNTKPSA